MRAIGRAFLILFGLSVAFAVGAMVLLFAIVLEPTFGRIVAYVAQAGLETAFDASTPEDAMRVLFGLWSMVVVVLAGPPALVALIGEIARTGSFVWYSGVTALLTAALPWIVRGGIGTTSPAELRVTLGLFLVGAASGFAYWLVVGRSAGTRPATPAPAP